MIQETKIYHEQFKLEFLNSRKVGFTNLKGHDIELYLQFEFESARGS